jgi:hypothetical protein
MDQLVMWILGFLVLIVLIQFFRFVKRKEIELEQAFQKRFSGRKILLMDKTARIIAQQSHGYSQKVGMGHLVLTSQELYFKMQLLNREVSIPAASLLNVGETRRMLGKNPLRTMLKVDFKTIDGKEDAIALIVKDLSSWRAEISNVITNPNN